MIFAVIVSTNLNRSIYSSLDEWKKCGDVNDEGFDVLLELGLKIFAGNDELFDGVIWELFWRFCNWPVNTEPRFCKSFWRTRDSLEISWTVIGLLGLPRGEEELAAKTCDETEVVPIIVTADKMLKNMYSFIILNIVYFNYNKSSYSAFCMLFILLIIII